METSVCVKCQEVFPDSVEQCDGVLCEHYIDACPKYYSERFRENPDRNQCKMAFGQCFLCILTKGAKLEGKRVDIDHGSVSSMLNESEAVMIEHVLQEGYSIFEYGQDDAKAGIIRLINCKCQGIEYMYNAGYESYKDTVYRRIVLSN